MIIFFMAFFEKISYTMGTLIPGISKGGCVMEHSTVQPPQPEKPQRTRRRSGPILRFMRGYLMLVGAGTTIYFLLTRLLIPLLIEVQNWISTPPVA